MDDEVIVSYDPDLTDNCPNDNQFSRDMYFFAFEKVEVSLRQVPGGLI